MANPDVWESPRSYPFVVITSLEGPNPRHIHANEDLEGNFLRVPIDSLHIAAWGFNIRKDAEKFALSYGVIKGFIDYS